MFQDLRYGARLLLKNPGFTSIAVITLALGIGANTAIFSVVHAVLLRPLPFPDQEQLVVAWKKDAGNNTPFVELAAAEVLDWQAQSQTFNGFAAMPATVYGYGYLLTGRGEPLQLESAKVTGRYFSILGARPVLGRVLDESDDRVNGPNVVVLSHQLWRDRFNSDPNLIGQTITLNHAGFTVLGVMRPEFSFPRGVDLWTPLLASMPARLVTSRTGTFLKAVGRLKPGITLKQGEAELNTIIGRLARQYPETKAETQQIVLTPLADYLFGDAKPALWALFAATGLLLLIAAANIANLFLARATSRRKELAVRAALGASRWQIIRQLLTESVTLAICGGAVGVALAYWLIDLLVAIAPADIPRLEDIRLSGAALLVSLLCTLLTTIIFGLLPALTVSRFNLNETLNEGSGKLAGSRTGHRLRGILVVCEVALTLVLLASSTLILRSFVNLSRAPLGFDPGNVLTMQLRLTGEKYNKVEARREFFRELIERIEARPGVEAASGVLIRPLEGREGWDVDFKIEGQSPDEAEKNPDSNFESINPHYFRALGITLKAGRGFDTRDQSDSPPVAIVSEALAKKYFGSIENAIDKRLELGLANSMKETWTTIVGVAGETRYRELQNSRLEIYVPQTQSGANFNHFVVRSTLDKANALALVKRELAAIDPLLAVSRVATMDEQVASQLARPRFSAMLLNWLAGLAMLLAAVGIFGVMAYSVAQRTNELGLRIALGAQPRNILLLVLSQGMKLAAAGVFLGLLAAAVVTRWLGSLLHGVSATDPLTFILIALILIFVALLACWIPARRAMKVDPMIALRYE